MLIWKILSKILLSRIKPTRVMYFIKSGSIDMSGDLNMGGIIKPFVEIDTQAGLEQQTKSSDQLWLFSRTGR